MTCGIYCIENKLNGKLYIGSSRDCERRKGEHFSKLRRGAHINKKLQAAWNKYGEANFEFTVIFTVLDPSALEAVEQGFLDESNVVEVGYNFAPTAGNTAGWKASEETRRRMSEAARKRDHSIQIAAMAEATRGKKRPAHVIEAMANGRKATPLSAESRRKMSESAKARGDRVSPEGRARAVAARKAQAFLSDEQREQMARMRAQGMKLKEIGSIFGLKAETTVYANIKRWHAMQKAA
jgi:group I intron endonuclease